MIQYTSKIEDFLEIGQPLEAGESEVGRSPSLLVPYLLMGFIPLGVIFWIYLLKSLLSWIF